MSVNQFFPQAVGETTELDLREQLIIESIQDFGFDVLYVPRQWLTVDLALKEITASSFPKAHKIEMLIAGLDELLRASFVMSQIAFGGIGTATVRLTVSKTRFRQEIPDSELSSPGRPCEGDLIFIPHAKVLLEIKDADPESMIRSGGKLHVYNVACELYKGEFNQVAVTPPDNLVSDENIAQLLLGDAENHDETTIPGIDIVTPGPIPIAPVITDVITTGDVR